MWVDSTLASMRSLERVTLYTKRNIVVSYFKKHVGIVVFSKYTQ